MLSDPTDRRDGRKPFHPADYGEVQWQRMLDYALERAEAFECVAPYRFVRQKNWRAPMWPPPLQALRADLIERHVSLIRWDRLHDQPCEFLRFRLTRPVRRFVRGTERLADWSWSLGRPEDPSFYTGDAPLLLTESAEGRVTVYATPEEREELGSVGVRLLEPLGVQAEPWPTP